MFWRILKKDLKRKRTMNLILLMFVILCSMFAAASSNNIAAVTGGIEHYFDIADMPDVLVTMDADSDEDKKIEALPGIKEIKTDTSFYIFSSKSFRLHGKKLDNFINPASFIADDEMAINYFDSGNDIIKDVEKGTFYSTTTFTEGLDIKEGDKVEINVDGFSYTLEFKGIFKGAYIQNGTSCLPYLLVDCEDMKCIRDGIKEQGPSYKSMYIKTDDPQAILDYADERDSVFATTRDEQKGIFIFDMMVAYIMMAISIIIMLAAFVVLRFTVGFTIQEEYREIGVMKALGLSNTRIRSLYIVKYLAIAVVGTAIGLVCSLPLSRVMLGAISRNMVIGSENGVVLGIVCSVCVVAIIMLFCYFCTRKVKRLSPLDAVRSGQTGERFRKKSLISIGRSKLPAPLFLALNDVLSAPKQYLLITAVFTLCVLMMNVMATSAVTLKSPKLMRFFCAAESEITILDTELIKDELIVPGGYQKTLDKTAKLLDELGIDAKYSTGFSSQASVTHGDKTSTRIFLTAVRGTQKFELQCDEGSAPQKTDEVALTGYALDDLDAKIGDRITADLNGKKHEFIITGRFSTYMGGGYAAYVSDDFDMSGELAGGVTGVQIKLNGDPDEKTVSDTIKKLSEKLESDKVFTAEDSIKMMTQASDPINAIKKLDMILTVILTSLIILLMERSFISKEKSEIALMKAVGIQSRSIILQHVLRFVIVSVIACIIASAAVLPISSTLLSGVSSVIGDVRGIDVDYSTVEVFVICPAILLAVTTIGAFITALHTKRITASDTASIE